MALAFPATYVLSAASKTARSANIRMSESESGVMRFLDLGAQTYWTIGVVIEHITESQMDTLGDWFATNEKAEIDLTVSTIVYRGYIDPRVGISSAPDPKNPNLWTMTFGFRGVKQ